MHLKLLAYFINRTLALNYKKNYDCLIACEMFPLRINITLATRFSALSSMTNNCK